MSTTLPQWTRILDNSFIQTWYDIKAEAIDNILLATNVWAMLKEKGRFKPQVGSEIISRSVRYAVGNPTVAVAKGDTLPLGVTETETFAKWTFRNVASVVQRDTITDAENAGKYKIKDYVVQRLGEARDSMTQNYETAIEQAAVTDESGKLIQGLNDLLPTYANAASGTYGGIARPGTFTQQAAANGVYSPSGSGGNTNAATTNPWWGSKYKQLTAPYEVNLVSDMKVLFNSITSNLESPDMLICDQASYELYEEFAVDKSQLVKNDRGMMADLGFETLEFKGKTMMWTPNLAANNIQMFNTNFIDVVYRPNLWFDMSEWKPIPNQMDRVAHIISAMNIVGSQPRRHGLLTSSTVS
jgi:hypothetical protein